MKTLLAALALVALASGATPALALCASINCAVDQPDTPAIPQENCGSADCAPTLSWQEVK